MPTMQGGYVYIMSNGPSGTLYVGVTSNLARRIYQHREGIGSIFCHRHCLIHLVYIERHDRIEDAIAREKAIKAWKREWKLNLIGKANPDWRDLFDEINA